MKSQFLASGVFAALIVATSALPTDYPPPPGGYPAPEGGYPAPEGGYPAPEGGYPAPEGGYPPPPGGYPPPEGGYPSPPGRGKGPFDFTSTYHIVATPDQVVNGTTPTGGLEGVIGYYDFGINSDLDLICYYIKLVGFRGEYQSMAKTSTHVHEANRGASGPPRLAFPNPTGDGHERFSVGCMTGPFTTGLLANGVDTGEGFKVKQIEDNSDGFFADVHSSLAVPGAVRGQFP